MLFLILTTGFSFDPGYAKAPMKKLNLSGTWVLSESKSDFGEYGRMWASDKLVIVHKGKNMSIERTGRTQAGDEFTIMENLTVDGKECVNQIFGESKKTSTVSGDKQSLTVNSLLNLEFEGQAMDIKTIEIYSLDDGGKLLVVNGSSSSSYGDMTVKFVYDKK
jgi:hypothetical protein